MANDTQHGHTLEAERMLGTVRIVLVNTTEPGNIGGVARAMKNMGLVDLHLVQPRHYPSADATARASGADDLLARAQVHEELAQALGDCHLVMGASARERTLRWPKMNPRQAAAALIEAGLRGPVALVFGRERTGLSNDELDLCHTLVQIPANPAYSSLNLAAAVQVISYELRMRALEVCDSGPVETEDVLGEPAASHEDVERFYRHLEQVLLDLDFLDPQNPRHLMRRLRRLFARTRLGCNEINILRGILAAMAARNPR